MTKLKAEPASEVAVGEGAQVDDGLLGVERAVEEADAADDADDRQDQHRLVLEPVVQRPLFQHIFEAAQERRHEAQARPVEGLEQAEIRLVEIDQQIGRRP